MCKRLPVLETLIEQLEDFVHEDPRPLCTIANDAGISHMTLRHWFTGVTANPNTRTLLSVCYELGVYVATCRKTGYPILKEA